MAKQRTRLLRSSHAVEQALKLQRQGRAQAPLQLERFDEALMSFDKALASTPNNVIILVGRGNALTRLKRPAEALLNYDRALALNPDHAEALTGRGAALFLMGRLDDALASFDRALRIEPKAVATHVNRGNVCLALARIDEALASYREAIAVDPENTEAHFGAALVKLCLGDFREGWKQYEYRWKKKEFATPANGLPRWRGDQELHGKTILLIAEQGFGDVIQFVRYAPLVAACGAKVLVGVHSSLTDLVATVPGISQVLGEDEALPDVDLYCPLLSLPLAFGTELTTIPAKVPYIRPYEERVAKWRNRLPQNGRLRVGVCWSGTDRHSNNRHRSLTLDRFTTILSVPGVDFVSLQREIEQSETAILSDYAVTELGHEFDDFADTAAVVSMLDLVISVDTSVAHLAGAMAKAVAVLIPFSPDFRWLLDRTDSPWYPTMRLFRQTAIGDWSDPLDRLRKELSGVAAQRQSAATAPV
jgi:tetratricopeptide (TPR) repeat protein